MCALRRRTTQHGWQLSTALGARLADQNGCHNVATPSLSRHRFPDRGSLQCASITPVILCARSLRNIDLRSSAAVKRAPLMGSEFACWRAVAVRLVAYQFASPPRHRGFTPKLRYDCLSNRDFQRTCFATNRGYMFDSSVSAVIKRKEEASI